MPDPGYADRVRSAFDDLCFACGRENHLGLGIEGFEADGDRVLASFSPQPLHRGLQSRLHGGLSATALDEILVWAAILLEGVLCVTGTLDLRYRRPVPVDAPLTLSARVDDRRGKRLRLSGHLADSEGPCVTASGLYLVTDAVDDLL